MYAVWWQDSRVPTPGLLPVKAMPRPPRHPWAEGCSGQCLDKLSKILHLPPSGPCVLQAQLGPTALMPNLWRNPPQRRLHHNLRCEQRVSGQRAGTSLQASSGWWIARHSGVRAGAGGAVAAPIWILGPRPRILQGVGEAGGPEPVWQTYPKRTPSSCPAKCQLLFAREATVYLLHGHDHQSLSPLQIVNGYFVHFFAPQGLPVVPKNLVFVIDVSGSMEGRKIKQVHSSVQVGVRGRVYINNNKKHLT